MHPRIRRLARTLLALPLALLAAKAADLPAFDFARPEVAAEWKALHDVDLAHTNGVLAARITGGDPYFAGPKRDYPEGLPLWMVLEVESDVAGHGQVFWAGPQPESEERSARFFIPAKSRSRIRVPLPPLAPGTRLRLDPPGTEGTCRLASLRFEPRPALSGPVWAPVGIPTLQRHPGRLYVDRLELTHDASGPGHFTLRLGAELLAIGHTNAPVGYRLGDKTRWFTLGQPLPGKDRFQRTPASIALESHHRDPDGGTWILQHEFIRTTKGFEVKSGIRVDQEREVVFAPALLLLPGVGSFGPHKSQGLLAGIEYLGDEESSSERDLVGRQALRQVPAPHKFTFPLMALAARDAWLSLDWEPHPDLAALHDSPDRITRSGGHLFGLIHPGADAARREDGSLMPYEGRPLKPGDILSARAFLAAGPGHTVDEAVRAFVSRHPLPPLPRPVPQAAEYFRLAARGWLDSGIRDGARYRHAIGNGFGSSHAPDAGYYMGWLASRVRDPGLAERLIVAARENREQVPAHAWFGAQVGHVKLASPALTALQATNAADHARTVARQHLDALGPQTRFLYRAPGGGARDLGATHFTNHANGLTATHLAIAFDQALLAGDSRLVDECLEHARRLPDEDEVPRGAQTWEVPLHTPDILASAYLLKVNVLAYELTGEPLFLHRAVYWAWTGVPFVYLASPGPGPVGVYSTTPVLGATQFIAPNWIGLPVQWCGLVYAEALLRLAPHDRSLDWRRLAHGIALAGVQHTHPESDGPAMGCLPDSFDLVAQSRNPVPINPGTLLPLAAEAYGEPPMQGFAVARIPRLWALAAGPVRTAESSDHRVRFALELPKGAPSQVVLGNVPPDARFHWNGRPLQPLETGAPVPGRALLTLDGPGELRVDWQP